jgi:HEAT repeat protein
MNLFGLFGPPNVAKLLARVGDTRAIPDLIPLLHFDDSEPGAVAIALVSFGSSAVEQLATALAGSDGNPRVALLRTLWMIFAKNGDQRALKAVTAFARQNDSSLVHLQAIGALELHLGDHILEPTIQLLTCSTDSVRPRAAKLLGKIGQKAAVNPLIVALGDKSQSVRQSATIALGYLGDRAAVEPLILQLLDDPGVRVCAAEALGMLGDVRAVEPLVDLLSDSVCVVRKTTRQALLKLADPRGIEAVRVAEMNEAAKYSDDETQRREAVEAARKRNETEPPDEINTCHQCQIALRVAEEVERSLGSARFRSTESEEEYQRASDACGVSCAVCGRDCCQLCAEKHGRRHPRTGGKACLSCGGRLTNYRPRTRTRAKALDQSALKCGVCSQQIRGFHYAFENIYTGEKSLGSQCERCGHVLCEEHGATLRKAAFSELHCSKCGAREQNTICFLFDGPASASMVHNANRMGRYNRFICRPTGRPVIDN